MCGLFLPIFFPRTITKEQINPKLIQFPDLLGVEYEHALVDDLDDVPVRAVRLLGRVLRPHPHRHADVGRKGDAAAGGGRRRRGRRGRGGRLRGGRGGCQLLVRR